MTGHRSVQSSFILMRRALALSLFAFLVFGQNKPTTENELWHLRNLGKAFYENPTTQVQAVDEFRKALAIAPDSAREQLNYALALLRAGKTDEGIALLQKIQKEHPDLPHTWFNLGIYHKKQGEFDKAITQFQRMVELVPNEPISRYNLGVLYRQTGRLDDAIKQFQEAIRLDHTFAAPHFQLFNIYRTTDRRNEANKELAEFQELKKAQEGSATPEDVDWSAYAEIYDPPDRTPPALPKVTEKWEPHPFPKPVDGWVILDVDGDNTPDLVTWTRGGLTVFRHGTEPMKNTGLEALTGIVSVAAGDFDNDGLMDLCILTEKEPLLYRNLKGKFEKSTFTLPPGHFDHAIWVDYDHDYDLDLVLLGENSKLLRNEGAKGFADHTADFPFEKGHAAFGFRTRLVPDSKAFDLVVRYTGNRWVEYRDLLGGKYVAAAAKSAPGIPEERADFDSDGMNDRISRDAVQLNRSTPKPNWIAVQLDGIKNLKLAQASLVEVKSSTLYEQRWYDGVPLTFDLGNHTQVDTVRITWPNGLIQNETQLAVNKRYEFKESQRLSGSCPMLWTWNGREFQFITDMLGVAPLGAMSGDGTYFPVDHDEYVMLPQGALAPKDGKYEVHFTEELSEVSYIDQMHLYAVDHPAGEEVFINEKWKSPPYPVFRYYAAAKRVYPKVAEESLPAKTKAGQGSRPVDVLPKITKLDRQYPDNFQRNELGSAELHYLTLDFGKAAPDNRAVMIMSGWLDWADGSTFRAASQESKEGLILPYLQVKNAKGEWQTVIDDMGMPDGKPKTIAVDLTGKFLTAGREVRIVTNLCVYWDEIFLSESSAVPTVRQTRVKPIAADVHFRGFSETRIHPERKQPDQFIYTNVSPESHWNPTPGMYTRYGDVRELLDDVDDRYVIMGSGDEIRLQLDAGSLPPLPAGWKRDFMIKIDGWAKDRDANTAFSQSVEPLPFHGMTSYPYPADEHYPKDTIHKQYLELYNTRPALRLVRPLTE